MNTDNPIKRILSAQISALAARFDESTALKHPGTIGALRESYLRDFLISIFPKRYVVGSGFVASCTSPHLSPQIDIVVANGLDIPHFSLHSDATVYPIESALACIEVKSQITDGPNGVFEQIKRQSSMMSTHLKPDFQTGSEKSRFMLPNFIAGYSTTMSKEKVYRLMIETGNTLGVLVFGKFSIVSRGTSRGWGYMVMENQGNHEETLSFCGHLYGILDYIESSRNAKRYHSGNYLLQNVWDKGTWYSEGPDMKNGVFPPE